MNTEIAVAHAQPAQPLSKRDADQRPAKISGKARLAIEAMVWLGLPRAKAAEHAGISEHGLYKALRKPPVRAHYLRELEVLRTSERARNIHTLAEVRDQQTNQMARVQAVKALEQLDDQPQSAAQRAQLPGFIIQVINAPAALTAQQRENAAKPLIQHEPRQSSPAALPHQGDADG